jgi:hypothetical protein
MAITITVAPDEDPAKTPERTLQINPVHMGYKPELTTTTSNPSSNAAKASNTAKDPSQFAVGFSTWSTTSTFAGPLPLSSFNPSSR